MSTNDVILIGTDSSHSEETEDGERALRVDVQSSVPLDTKDGYELHGILEELKKITKLLTKIYA